MAEKVTIIMPMLPPSLSAEGKTRQRGQQAEEKKWQDYIASEWALLGKPKFNTIRVTLIFSFPEKGNCVLADYLATGSKLVAEAIKGRFIPDDGPEQLMAWSFLFEFGDKAQTKIIFEAVRQADEEWQRPSCSLYENCNAPICPLDQTSLKGTWYPKEEICHSRTQGNLPWIRAQRKIATSGAPADRYFNLLMLERNCIIKKGIAGLDPNEADITQFKKWLADHPVKKEMSEEEKKARSAHLKKFQFQDADT